MLRSTARDSFRGYITTILTVNYNVGIAFMTPKQIVLTASFLLAVSAISVGVELWCGWVSYSLDRGFLRWQARGVYILGFYLLAKLVQAVITKKPISPSTAILLVVSAIVAGIELWCWWGACRGRGMVAMLVGLYGHYILGFYLGAKLIQAAILGVTKKQISFTTAIVVLVSAIAVGMELWPVGSGGLLFLVGGYWLIMVGFYLVGKLLEVAILGTNAKESAKLKLNKAIECKVRASILIFFFSVCVLFAMEATYFNYKHIYKVRYHAHDCGFVGPLFSSDNDELIVYPVSCGFVAHRYRFFVKKRFRFTKEISTRCSPESFEIIHNELHCYTHEWQHPPGYSFLVKDDKGDFMAHIDLATKGKNPIPGFKMSGPLKVEYF